MLLDSVIVMQVIVSRSKNNYNNSPRDAPVELL